MKKYLVFGANGQLGQALYKVLPPGFELVVPSGNHSDITEIADLLDAFNEHLDIDGVINCAAYTAVDKAETDRQKALEVNAFGPAMIARLCKEREKDFVHVSTDYVFDGSFPGTEGLPTNPLNWYGYSKAMGEEMVMAVNPQSLIIRTASVYSEFGNNFLKTLLSRYHGGQREFDVVCDHFSCPTYAPDLALTILEMLHFSVCGRIMHFAGNDYVSWDHFAKAIFDQVDSSVIINPVLASHYKSVAVRPAKSFLVTQDLLCPRGIGYGIEETLKVLLNKERE